MKIDLVNLVIEVVKQSSELKDKYTDQIDAQVNYACIFSHDGNEFDELKKLVGNIGKIVEETPSGPLYYISLIETVSGPLKLLKVRQPDVTRPERGDADFTVDDYVSFKEKYLKLKNFTLIEREEFEMIELMDSRSDVRTYFSHPPLDEQQKLKS